MPPFLISIPSCPCTVEKKLTFYPPEDVDPPVASTLASTLTNLPRLVHPAAVPRPAIIGSTTTSSGLVEREETRVAADVVRELHVDRRCEVRRLALGREVLVEGRSEEEGRILWGGRGRGGVVEMVL